MKLNSIFWVMARNKQAVYINEQLFFSEKQGNYGEKIGYIIADHSPADIEQIVIGVEVDEFPKLLKDFKEKYERLSTIDKNDLVTFTTYYKNELFYGEGVVEESVTNQNGNLSYLVRVGKELFKITPDENKNDTILFSTKNHKYSALGFKKVQQVLECRDEIMLPKVGQKVSYTTENSSGEGIIERIFKKRGYCFSCKIKNSIGSIVEVFENSKRYPKDEVLWHGKYKLLEGACLK